MKPVICIYCEGSDTKIAVVSKDQKGIKILRTETFNISSDEMFDISTKNLASDDQLSDFNVGDIEGDIAIDTISETTVAVGSSVTSDVSTIVPALADFKLNQTNFIPVVTEPTINYHVYEGDTSVEKKKLIEAILRDIQETKNITVQKDFLNFVKLNDKSAISAFVEGEIQSVGIVNSLAAHNSRRFYKIPTIKSAELALAYYVSANTKFFPEDYTLIIYTGKESSKLIFLEGQNIKHIGSPLDIGTQNLSTYDVYFSKILLEMENGGLPRLDNVVLCGEDSSENLILSFYGTFPEANVIDLKFDNVTFDKAGDDEKINISPYAIPISAAVEYIDELDKKHKGFNILPKFIVENQRFFQFGWHSYIMLPLLFAATFYMTFTVLSNFKQISELDAKIEQLEILQAKNQTILDELSAMEYKISSFDETQSILDAATEGTEIWSKILDKTADFIERRRNFWITKLEAANNTDVNVSGYSLSRSVLTEFADYNSSSLLNSIFYDPLREQNAFEYKLNFKLSQNSADSNGP